MPETIDFLKDNIHEAIGEIQLHTRKFEKIFRSFFEAFSKKKKKLFGRYFIKLTQTA